MIFDAFTFWKELDLLRLRFEILDPYVDKFILVESRQTFSGEPKPLYYEENRHLFDKWNNKIIHIIAPNIELKNPNYLFERHHLCYELMEKKIMEMGLPNDIVFLGDLDEVWNPEILDKVDEQSHILYMLAYAYWLNNRCSERWTGSLMTKVKNIFVGFTKKTMLDKPYPLDNAGWHFTNMGGSELIIEKLNAYDHSNEIIPVLSQFEGLGIQDRMDNDIDFLGRALDYEGQPFKFWLDESEWPKYLKDNRQEWNHLCK